MQVPWPEHAFGQQPASADGKNTLSEKIAPRAAAAGSIHLEGAIFDKTRSLVTKRSDPAWLQLLLCVSPQVLIYAGDQAGKVYAPRKLVLEGHEERKTDGRDGLLRSTASADDPREKMTVFFYCLFPPPLLDPWWLNSLFFSQRGVRAQSFSRRSFRLESLPLLLVRSRYIFCFLRLGNNNALPSNGVLGGALYSVCVCS